MDLAWLVPFAGFLWYRIQGMMRLRTGVLSDNALGAGCATLSSALLLNGIFEIAGTSSSYLPGLYVTGQILTGAGLAAALIGWIPLRRRQAGSGRPG